MIERLCGAKSGVIDHFVRPDADMADALKGWRSVLERQHKVVSLKAEIIEAKLALAQDPNDGTWARLQELMRQAHCATEDETELEKFG